MPLYYQLKQILVEQIDVGTWKPGELIPGEHELQNRFGLSRTTVRQALRELETEGRVVRQRGRGTFVTAPKLTHEPDTDHGLTESIAASGMKAGWQVLSAGWSDTPDETVERLRLAPGEQVYRLHRLRMAGDQPIAVHLAYVAPVFVKAIDSTLLAEGGSLHYLTSSGQLDGCRAERLLEAVPADRDTSEALGISMGAPMLQIRRLLRTASGQPAEDFIGIYRGDRFQYRVAGAAPPTL
ncbi:MAG: GntR family transcriptional regulator [Proteobacteria bacterium]|nr:GntR family transcriptional regulator [Pseudomonadota bacterium]